MKNGNLEMLDRLLNRICWITACVALWLWLIGAHAVLARIFGQ